MTQHRSFRDIFKSAAAAAVLAAPLALATPALAQDNAAPAGGAATAPAESASGLTVGPVTFGAPWVLLGLGTLPLLWYLMRSVPPKPRQEYFPAMRILFNLNAEEQEPARMPLWQRVMRLTAAGAVITGLAQPELNPLQALNGDGPVVAVIDNGWGSAHNWEARTLALNNLIDRAENENRQVILLPTAPPAEGGAIRVTGPVDARKAREMLQTLAPQPWPVDREAALKALETTGLPSGAHIAWLSDGIDDPGATALAQRLSESGGATIFEDSADSGSHLLIPVGSQSENLTITVRRPKSGAVEILNLTASDEQGRALAQAEAQFGPSDTETKAVFTLPPDARNLVTRVAIAGENSAGAVVLLDERWRRRPVGLVRLPSSETSQPLLEEANYVERALTPYVDLRQGSVDDILKRPPAVMIITDAVPLDNATRAKLTEWIEKGGTLLRFAGPRLTEMAPDDNLLPVRLRQGTRTLGKSLSDEKAGTLAPFEEKSPFFGIKIPPNVAIDEEVMAQPEFDLNDRTWARLQDGTPFVTAKPMGKGQVVLVHTTANTGWSNLPLSGVFVDMLRAVVANSQGVGGPGGATQALPPWKIMDASGQLKPPAGDVRPLSPQASVAGTISPQNPPGLYGDEAGRHAHNLFNAVPALQPLPELPALQRQSYDSIRSQNDLTGPLLATAFAILMADLIILMAQQRTLPRLLRRNEGNGFTAPNPQ